MVCFVTRIKASKGFDQTDQTCKAVRECDDGTFVWCSI